MALMPLLLRLMGDNDDPIRVLNRGVRIRGEGRVVEGLRVNGTDEVEAEGRKKWCATGVVVVDECGILGEFGRLVVA
jgi:hypothetical protein